MAINEEQWKLCSFFFYSPTATLTIRAVHEVKSQIFLFFITFIQGLDMLWLFPFYVLLYFPNPDTRIQSITSWSYNGERRGKSPQILNLHTQGKQPLELDRRFHRPPLAECQGLIMGYLVWSLSVTAVLLISCSFPYVLFIFS